jgi:hypothetical protein
VLLVGNADVFAIGNEMVPVASILRAMRHLRGASTSALARAAGAGAMRKAMPWCASKRLSAPPLRTS